MSAAKDKRLAIFCIIEIFLLTVSQTVISLGVGQKQVIFYYSAWIYGTLSIVCVLCFLTVCLRKLKITCTELLTVLFIIYALVNMMITASVNGGYSDSAYDTLLEFGVKALPAMLLACAASRKRVLGSIVEYLDWFVLIGTICIAKTMVGSMTQGVSRGYLFARFGVDYQLISYYAADFFALDLYMVFSGKKYLKNRRGKSRWFQALRVVCALLLSFSSLSSGGRGGFLLILVMTVFWLTVFSIKRKQYGRLLASIVLIAVLIAVVNALAQNNAILSNGIARAFEYFGSGTINWEGTSGRQEIYLRDWKLILQAPLLGYGFTGSTYHNIRSTHNLLFEVLVEGGLVYFAFCTFVLIRFGQKLRRMIRGDDRCLLLLIVFFCDFIPLLFSFIYWRRTAIWFAVIYVLNSRETPGGEAIE